MVSILVTTSTFQADVKIARREGRICGARRQSSGSRRKAVHPRRGWSIFYAQAFAAPISIGLGVNVSYSSNEIGMTHTWSVTIGNEAGIPIIPEMKGQLQIPQLLSGLPSAAVNRVPFAMQISLAVPATFGTSTSKTDFNAIFVRAVPVAMPPLHARTDQR